jgi:hypothetical protein
MFSDFLQWKLLIWVFLGFRPVKDFIDELLPVNVKKVFIFAKLLKKLVRTSHVFLAHLHDLFFCLNDPREFLSNGEVSHLCCGLMGQILHKVVFQLMELVSCLHHVDKLLNHEVLAVLQRGVELNFSNVIVFLKALLCKDLLDSFLIHTFLDYSGLLGVFLFVFNGLTLADVNCKESCLAACPELTLIVLWNSECLDECDPSIDRALYEIT